MALGYIRVAHDEYGALKLEPSAHGVFKKEVSVTLRRDTVDAVRKRERGKPVASAARTGMSVEDEKLFQTLRALRLSISKEQGVAPYVVFPDTTLIAFATIRPTTERDMLSISGVGATKFARYGEQFMEIISEG